MKRAVLLTIMALWLAGAGLSWGLSLTPGLPVSVYLYELGRLMGLLGFVLVTFQYLWVAKSKFLEAGVAPGWFFRVHRRAGMFGLGLLVLHPAAILVSEKLQGYASPMGALRILGMATFLLLLAAGGATLFAGRLNLKIKTWKAIHRLAYGVFPLAFAHSFLLGTTLQKGVMKAAWVLLAVIYLGHLTQRVIKGSSRKATVPH